MTAPEAPERRKTFEVDIVVNKPVLDEDGDPTVGEDGTIQTQSETRTVIFMEATSGQLSQIARGASQINRVNRFGGARSEAAQIKVIDGIGKVLQVLALLALKQADRDWLEDAMEAGWIEVAEYVKVLDRISEETDSGKPVKAAKSGRR